VSWYNDLRTQVCPERPQLIESTNPNALCVLLISNNAFFGQVVDTYKETREQISSNFVERTTTRLLNDLVCKLRANGFANEVSSYNLDMAPFLHAQSLGYVSGMVEYLSPDDDCIHACESANLTKRRLEENRLYTQSRLLSLTLHPIYGGWFAYRGLLVFHDTPWPITLSRPKPLTFLTPEQKRTALHEYNVHPEMGYWRDLNNRSLGKVERYDLIQFAFFHEPSTDRRRRILEILSDENHLRDSSIK
jgi:hypothetical protein